MNKEKIGKILPSIIYLASLIVCGFYCYAGTSLAQSNFEMVIICGITMIVIYLASIEYHLNSRE